MEKGWRALNPKSSGVQTLGHHCNGCADETCLTVSGSQRDPCILAARSLLVPKGEWGSEYRDYSRTMSNV